MINKTNVTQLDIVTTLDLNPDNVLTAAFEHGLEVAIVVGIDHNGDFYFASSAADGGVVNFWLDRAKYKLMERTDDLERGE